jgi:hypothetical protein
LDPHAVVEEARAVVALLDDMHESNALLFPEIAIETYTYFAKYTWGKDETVHATKIPKIFLEKEKWRNRPKFNSDLI